MILAWTARSARWKRILHQRRVHPQGRPCGDRSLRAQRGLPPTRSLKSSIFCAMDGAHKEHEAVLKGVKVMVKPCKSVVAVLHFKKQQLVLVPITCKIDAKAPGASQGVSLGELLPKEEFSLLPWVALPRNDARDSRHQFALMHPMQPGPGDCLQWVFWLGTAPGREPARRQCGPGCTAAFSRLWARQGVV